MKISNLLLGASLAANAALVGGFMLGAWGSPHSVSDTAVAPASSATAASNSAPAAARDPITGKEWAALPTEDLAALRDRLRAEGFPPAVIRMILSAQLGETFAARRKAIEASRGETPYWKPLTPDPQTQMALRALEREAREALTALVGPDPENGTAATLQRQYPGFAADKIAQLASIRDDYEQRRGDVYASSGTALSRDKISALDAAMHAEVAALLTPQELEDYDLRTSNIAGQLRNTLVAFDATEQEFRTLYQLQQSFSERLDPTGAGVPSPDRIKARTEAQNELNDQIKAALGDDRYAEYKRATDYGYQQTSKLVARLALPPETSNQMWALQQDIQQRAAALRIDRTLSAADRLQQLAALNDEATAKVTATLGEQGFAAYQQYGGTWMRNILPALRPLPGAASAVPLNGNAR